MSSPAHRLFLIALLSGAFAFADSPCKSADSGSVLAGWTVADFDGDGRADVASLVVDGNSPSRCGMRVQFGSNRLRLPLSGDQLGVTLIARDVDSDNDFDIVVTSSFLKRPIQVWINDGTGSFHQGDLAVYPSLAWRPDDLGFRSSSKLRVVECPSENQGGRYALALGGSCDLAIRYNEGILRWSCNPVSSIPVEHGRSRAPPALS